MLSGLWQGAATDSAQNYGPGTHSYSWVERDTICVHTLPKNAILKRGQYRYRIHDPWIVSPTLYHYAAEATNSEASMANRAVILDFDQANKEILVYVDLKLQVY